MANESQDVVTTAEQAKASGLTLAQADELGDRIAAGIASGIAQTQGPRKVTIGQYQRLHKRKVSLSREYYQNTHRLFLEDLTDDQVKLLNKLHRSGRYLKNKVQVIVRGEGQSVAEQTVHIMYSDATPDQRMENYKLFRDFTDLVKQLVDAQEIETENEQIDKEWLEEKRRQQRAKSA